MNTTKSTKRSLMMSIVSLLLCFSMLLGTTYAWFTDSATSSGNKIQAGTLDVELWLHGEGGSTNIGDSGTPLFGVNSDSLATADPANTVWEPGKTQTVYLSIKNAGNLDLKYAVAIEVTKATGGLEKYMEYKITPDARYNGGKIDWTAGEGKKVTKGTNPDATDVFLAAGKEHFFALSIHMDELATNAQMGESIEFDIKVLATQVASESDSLGNGYDANATYPSVNTEKVPTNAPAEGTPISNDNVTVVVPKTAEAGNYALEVANKEVVTDNGNGEGEINLDITLKKDGVKVSGDTSYTVRVKIAKEGTPLNIAKVTHNGEEITVYTYYEATGEIEFTTTHFSPFVITYYDSNVSVNLPEGATDADKAEAMGEKLSTLIAKGGTFTLTEDVVLTEALVVPEGKTVTLDLNGKTITAGEDGYALLNESGSNVILTDSANGGEIVGVISNANGSVMTVEGGTYSAKEGGKYVFLNDAATLTINGGTINGGSSYPVYSYNDGQQLTINDVTVNGIFGALNAYGTGTVEINGGTYNMTGVAGKTSHIAYFSTTATVVINGGSFNHVGDISMSATGGGGICVAGSANVTINGGEFNGDYSDIYNWGNANAILTIKGGSFAHNFDAKYVAEGFKLVEAGNAYTVISSDRNYVADGVLVSTDGKTYYVSNAAGWAWVEAQTDKFFSGKTVAIDADIDFGGATIKPVRFGDSENKVVLDGLGHTLSNFVIVNNSGNAGLVEGIVDVKSLNIEGATVTGKYVGVIAGNMYGNIEYCSVKNSTINGTYWQTGALAGQYNAGNIIGCSVDNCVINGMSAVGAIVGILNETAGVRKIENCTVSNTTINQIGSFGGDYDNYFGVAVGLVNVVNSTVYFNNVKLENNTLKGAASDLMFGEAEESNYIYIDDAVASTLALEEAIKAGTKAVILAEGDYALRFTNNTNFNLNDMTIKGLGNVNLAISSTEAWYGRIQGSNVTFENIHFTSSVGATGKATYNNCTFDDWTICASSNKEETTFNNCTINGCLNTSTDFSSGDVFVKNCKIAKAEYSGSMTMNFVNCQIGEIIIWNANTNLTNCKVTKLDDSNVTNATVTIK